MSRIARIAWLSFGRLLDLAPHSSQAGKRIRKLGRKLSFSTDRQMIGGDFKRIGHDIKIAMRKI